MFLSAISHNSTSRDCYALAKDSFRVRLRTAKGDISEVILHYQDKYLPLRIQDTRAQKNMVRIAQDYVSDYWEAELSFHVVCLRYWFEIRDTKGQTFFYSNYRFSESPFSDTDDMFDCPQNLREEEQFVTPAWAENKVIYQVFPSRFATSKNVPPELWYKAPVSFRDDLGGDLRGIIQHLDHLKELGVDILYMTPIFRSDSCHKYDTIDYYTIDPSFGTKEDLLELVNKAHSMGLRVILDGVFNHTSPDFFAFADIKKNGFTSRFIDWYFIEGFPLKSNWGEKPNYKTFSYFGGMPKLNMKNPEVSQYVTDVALYWLRECHIDGWRLDVGDEISHRFWRKFRDEIKAEFPDALIIGEVWHYAEDFLQGDEWDTVMNYPFYQSILRFAAKGECRPSDFASDMDFLKGRYHERVFPLLWNLVGSHDTPRILHQCGGSKERLKLVAALQLLLPGMPMVYYGDEYGMGGGQDPDCRRGMLWNPEKQDSDLFRWYQQLIHIRHSFPELLSRDILWQADDMRSLLIRNSGKACIVFHSSADTAECKEYAGKTDLLSGDVFDGTLAGFTAKVFIL